MKSVESNQLKVRFVRQKVDVSSMNLMPSLRDSSRDLHSIPLLPLISSVRLAPIDGIVDRLLCEMSNDLRFRSSFNALGSISLMLLLEMLKHTGDENRVNEVLIFWIEPSVNETDSRVLMYRLDTFSTSSRTVTFRMWMYRQEVPPASDPPPLDAQAMALLISVTLQQYMAPGMTGSGLHSHSLVRLWHSSGAAL